MRWCAWGDPKWGRAEGGGNQKGGLYFNRAVFCIRKRWLVRRGGAGLRAHWRRRGPMRDAYAPLSPTHFRTCAVPRTRPRGGSGVAARPSSEIRIFNLQSLIIIKKIIIQ